ncbi:MAG: Adaptive-response sensory-kinase SasA [Anaerolineales bacterium]|nr:Adaptive-response sensory-kinase SasA [Anaerolineales bacterium]
MKRPSTRARAWFDRLAQPHPSIDDVGRQYQSRLLTVILLIMTGVFLTLDIVNLVTVPGYKIPWYGYVFLVGAIALNRSGWYRVAAMLTLVMFPTVIFTIIASGAATDVEITLSMLVLGIILGGILLSRRGLILLAGLNLIGIVVTALVVPSQTIELASIIGAAAILLITAVLSIILMHQRDQIEAARQAALRESRDRLQLAMQAVRMGTWEWDLASNRIRLSGEAESLFHVEHEEFDGTLDSLLCLLPRDEQRKVQGAINYALDSHSRDFHVIHNLRTRQNEIRWLEGRGIVEYDEAREPLRIVGTVVDITDRLLAEAERASLLGRMEKRNAHLATAARVSRTCNSILDPAHLVQSAVTLITEGFELYYVGLFIVKDNLAYLQAGYGDAGQSMVAENFFLQLDETSMVGWSILHRQARIAQQALNDNVRRLNPLLPETRSEMSIPLISRERVIGALTIQSREENAFNASDTSILQTMSDQIAISIENARLFSDAQAELAQRRQIEQERETLIRELESKNAELERFTYTVSHDLKSPLITIRGFLGHLLNDVERGDRTRMLDDAQRISDATNRMQKLLEDLLELSRVGRLISPPERVPFEQIVQEALALVEGRIASRRVEVRLAANLPHVMVDRVRLVEAMQNLLDNAAKFTGEQSSPVIEIGCDQGGAEAVFFVKDNGIGIEPKFHAKIFGLFDKLNPSTEGTGVGLALVKRIIEVHTGRIWIESEAGSGTTFRFTLPLAESEGGPVA